MSGPLLDLDSVVSLTHIPDAFIAVTEAAIWNKISGLMYIDD